MGQNRRIAALPMTIRPFRSTMPTPTGSCCSTAASRASLAAAAFAALSRMRAVASVAATRASNSRAVNGLIR